MAVLEEPYNGYGPERRDKLQCNPTVPDDNSTARGLKRAAEGCNAGVVADSVHVWESGGGRDEGGESARAGACRDA